MGTYVLGHAVREITGDATSGWGTAAWGGGAWGGGDALIQIIADPSARGDNPQGPAHEEAYTVEHKRAGQIIAEYLYDSRQVWALEWDNLSASDLATLRSYFQLRSFYYYPDYDDQPSQRFTVRWIDRSFRPVAYRGGTVFKLRATWEQVAS